MTFKPKYSLTNIIIIIAWQLSRFSIFAALSLVWLSGQTSTNSSFTLKTIPAANYDDRGENNGRRRAFLSDNNHVPRGVSVPASGITQRSMYILFFP